MQNRFDITFTSAPDVMTAHLSGDLDLPVRDLVVAQVVEHTTPDVRHIVLDLECVTFCDSSGLSALLDVKRHADRAGVSLSVTSVPASVARLLELADVGAWLSSG
jgi:anti-sigma B factor antagonist